MSSYEKIAAYLEAHPTPWRWVRQTEKKLPLDMRSSVLAIGYDDVRCIPHKPDCDVIVDANGDLVIETWDGESYNSGLGGDVRALVDFVNLVGNDYEPPCGWPGVDYGPIEPVNDKETEE